jgi:hypothetical protein
MINQAEETYLDRDELLDERWKRRKVEVADLTNDVNCVRLGVSCQAVERSRSRASSGASSSPLHHVPDACLLFVPFA